MAESPANELDDEGAWVNTATAWISRHRALAYLVATAALVGLIVLIPDGVTAAANEPTPTGTGGGNAFTNVLAAGGSMDIREASNYLAWNRWWSVNSLGSPSISISNIGMAVAAGLISFGRLALLVASFCMYIIGQAMVLVIDFDLIGRMAATVDYMFASVGNTIMGHDSGPSGVGVALIGSLIVALVVYSIFSGLRGGLGTGIKVGVAGFLAIGALGIMSTQATQNVPDSGAPSAPLASDSDSITDPAAGSPGWIISIGKDIGDWAGDMVSGVADSLGGVADRVHDPDSLQEGTCGPYVNAMHDIYRESGHSALPLQYDRLALAIYFDTYRMAAFGDTNSSNHSWCRVAEVVAGVPASEQIYVATKAGLYQEMVGTNSSLFVDGDGNWRSGTAGGNSYSAADSQVFVRSIFGPTFISPGAMNSATAYWAACTWQPNRDVRVSPHWNRVAGADWLVDKGFFEELRDTSRASLLLALGREDGAIQWIGEEAQGDWKGDSYNETWCHQVFDPKEGHVGFDLGGNATDVFNFHEPDDGLLGLFGVRTSETSGLFAEEVAGGDTDAIEYYTTSQGLNYSWTMIVSFITLALVLVMTKYVFPLVVGGIIAQAMGAAAWIVAVFVLAAMIIPMRATYRMGRTVGLTILWAAAAQVLYTTILAIMMSTFTIFRGLLHNPDTAGILRVLQIGLAAILAFYVIRKLLEMLFNYDMTSFKGAVKSAGWMSGRAVMQARGMEPPAVLSDRVTNRMGRGSQRSAGDASPVRASANRIRNRADMARDGLTSLMDRRRSAQDAKTTKAGAGADTKTPKTTPQTTGVAGRLDKVSKGADVAGDVAKVMGYGRGARGAERTKTVFGKARDIVASFVGEGAVAKTEGTQDPIAAATPEQLAQKGDRTVGGPASTPAEAKTPEQVAEDMERFGGSGELGRNPGTIEDPILRTYTMADLFGGATPVTMEQLQAMTPEEREAYLSRRLDDAPQVGRDGTAWFSVPPGMQDSSTGPMVIDPRTGMMVPAALVGAGTPSARKGTVTTNGVEYEGMVRGDDGLWRPRQAGSSKLLLPRVFESNEAPAGVDQETWDDLRDLRGWLNANELDSLNTDPELWPEARREQYARLSSQMGSMYSALGVNIPEMTDEEIAASGVGLSASTGRPLLLDDVRIQRAIDSRQEAIRGQYISIIEKAIDRGDSPLLSLPDGERLAPLTSMEDIGPRHAQEVAAFESAIMAATSSASTEELEVMISRLREASAAGRFGDAETYGDRLSALDNMRGSLGDAGLGFANLGEPESMPLQLGSGVGMPSNGEGHVGTLTRTPITDTLQSELRSIMDQVGEVRAQELEAVSEKHLELARKAAEEEIESVRSQSSAMIEHAHSEAEERQRNLHRQEEALVRHLASTDDDLRRRLEREHGGMEDLLLSIRRGEGPAALIREVEQDAALRDDRETRAMIDGIVTERRNIRDHVSRARQDAREQMARVQGDAARRLADAEVQALNSAVQELSSSTDQAVREAASRLQQAALSTEARNELVSDLGSWFPSMRGR